LDDIGDESEGDLTKILEGLIAEAEVFYTREVERYNL
jgi:hypothetical protein